MTTDPENRRVQAERIGRELDQLQAKLEEARRSCDTLALLAPLPALSLATSDLKRRVESAQGCLARARAACWRYRGVAGDWQSLDPEEWPGEALERGLEEERVVRMPGIETLLEDMGG